MEFKESINTTLFRLFDHISLQFLQTYYSQVLGFQVLINPYATEVTGSFEVTTKKTKKNPL